MKVYVTARFKGAENKQEIEDLCHAVRAAGLKDFSFQRDVEHYTKKFDDPKELWQRAFDEIGSCDALLIDATDQPSGGRMIETGIAYALHKPIITIVKEGVEFKKHLFDGVSEKVLIYKDYKDLTHQLKAYDRDRTFSSTDKTTLLVMFLMVGAVIGWFTSQLFIPLGLIAVVAYWLLVRRFFSVVRPYDRLVIYIPLIGVWTYGYALLEPLYLPLALAWAIIFWVVTLLLLRKLKFSV